MEDEAQAFPRINPENDGLDESLGNASVDSFPSFGSFNDKDVPQTNDKNSSPKTDSIEEYGIEVVTEMKNKNIVPNPKNYQIYFEKLLEDKSDSFKKEALKSMVGSVSIDHQLALEANISRIQKEMVNALSMVNSAYKNMLIFKDILTKHTQEVGIVNSASSLENIISVFKKELSVIDSNTGKQLRMALDAYNKCNSEVKILEESGVYDNRYGIYNRRYLEAKLEEEIEDLQDGKHKSSLVFIKTAKNLESKITNKKNVYIINKTISKVLQKNITKSDVLSYFGEGVFTILLSHGDKEFSKRFVSKVSEIIAMSNIFVGDEALNLEICCGILELNPSMKSVVAFKNGIEALKKASTRNEIFVTYGEQ